MKHTNRHALAWAAASLLLAGAAQGADVYIPFPTVAQEHSNWCWAGTSVAILSAYGTKVDQCTTADFALGRADCCGNTTFAWAHACNVGQSIGSIQRLLGNWNVASTIQPALTQAAVVTEINAGRPFLMAWAWTAGGAHALDAFGFEQNGKYIWYMDPWPGNGAMMALYSWVKSASDHVWTDTVVMTTNRP